MTQPTGLLYSKYQPDQSGDQQQPDQGQKQNPLLALALLGGLKGGGSAADNLTSPTAADAPSGYEIVGSGADGAPMLAPGAESPGLLSSAASLAGPLAVAGIGGYTANQALQAHNKAQGQGALGGLEQGIKSAGMLNAVPVLGQAAWISGLLGGAFGGKKGKDQRGRDADRATAQQSGLLDSGYNVTLGDGTKVDLGRDGSVKNYNLDLNSPGVGSDIGLVDPLSTIVSGGRDKGTSDMTGQLLNAARSSGDAHDNIVGYYKSAGLDRNSARQAIEELHKEGKIDDGRRDSLAASIDRLYGVKNPNAGKPKSNSLAGMPR